MTGNVSMGMNYWLNDKWGFTVQADLKQNYGDGRVWMNLVIEILQLLAHGKLMVMLYFAVLLEFAYFLNGEDTQIQRKKFGGYLGFFCHWLF